MALACFLSPKMPLTALSSPIWTWTLQQSQRAELTESGETAGWPPVMADGHRKPTGGQKGSERATGVVT